MDETLTRGSADLGALLPWEPHGHGTWAVLRGHTRHNSPFQEWGTRVQSRYASREPPEL